MIRPNVQKGKPTKSGNGGPADMFRRNPEFSPDGFASPSFEEFAFGVSIKLNTNYRRPLPKSLESSGNIL